MARLSLVRRAGPVDDSNVSPPLTRATGVVRRGGVVLEPVLAREPDGPIVTPGATSHTADSWPEVTVHLVAVVAPTTELDVVQRRLPARGVRNDVVELQEPSLVAPPTAARDESTPAAVSRDRIALHVRRNVAGGVRLTASLSRAGGSGKLSA